MVYLLGQLTPCYKIFRMQKRIVRIMMGCKNRVSCRNLFRRLEILPFVSQYILLLMLLLVKNKNLFILNSDNHTKSNSQFNNFYQPIMNFTVYQRALRFPTIYLHTLKIYPIMQGNLKFA